MWSEPNYQPKHACLCLCSGHKQGRSSEPGLAGASPQLCILPSIPSPPRPHPKPGPGLEPQAIWEELGVVPPGLYPVPALWKTGHKELGSAWMTRSGAGPTPPRRDCSGPGPVPLPLTQQLLTLLSSFGAVWSHPR